MSEVSIIKLRDGSTLVGKITEGENTVEIEHPIELVPGLALPGLGNIIGEQIHLKPWIAIAEDDIFTIERRDIITRASLNNRFIPGYKQMVQQIYHSEQRWGGDFIEEGERGLPELIPDDKLDLDADLLTELADAVLNKKIH
tara:strand:- start:457 stop:882 length:426 start_codon:yes stop_codon:yes gene_type:complete